MSDRREQVERTVSRPRANVHMRGRLLGSRTHVPTRSASHLCEEAVQDGRDQAALHAVRLDHDVRGLLQR